MKGTEPKLEPTKYFGFAILAAIVLWIIIGGFYAWCC